MLHKYGIRVFYLYDSCPVGGKPSVYTSFRSVYYCDIVLYYSALSFQLRFKEPIIGTCRNDFFADIFLSSFSNPPLFPSSSVLCCGSFFLVKAFQ